jgi:hypothetical protein
VRFAIQAHDLPSNVDVSTLAMVEQRGRYAGRTITYFRVFNPTQVAAHAPDVATRLSYADLESRPELVLCAGMLEQDGTVVMTHVPVARLEVPQRQAADRAAHADDERFVFPPSRP